MGSARSFARGGGNMASRARALTTMGRAASTLPIFQPQAKHIKGNQSTKTRSQSPLIGYGVLRSSSYTSQAAADDTDEYVPDDNDDKENWQYRRDTMNKEFKNNTPKQAVKTFEKWRESHKPSLKTIIYMAEKLLSKDEIKTAFSYIEEVPKFKADKEMLQQIVRKAMDWCREKGKFALYPDIKHFGWQNGIDIKTTTAEENITKGQKVWKHKLMPIDLPQGYKIWEHKNYEREVRVQRKHEIKGAKKKN